MYVFIYRNKNNYIGTIRTQNILQKFSMAAFFLMMPPDFLFPKCRHASILDINNSLVIQVCEDIYI